MSRPGLVSPRGGAPPAGDFGRRATLIARQRVDRTPPRRPGRRQRLLGRAAVAVALLLGLAAIGGAAHWALTSPRFAVAVVEVRGNHRVSGERIRAAAGIPPGANLWTVDPQAVSARVLALPGIRRVEVIRQAPNHVVLQVEERRPFTLVSSGRLYWLDEEGRALGEAPAAVAPPVPVVSGLSEEELATAGTAPGPRVRAALALIRSLLRTGSPLSAEISEIDMSGRDGPVLYTVDGIEVRLGAEDWAERLARLEGVLGQVASQDHGVSAIDLRFRDQVVLTRGGRG